MTGSRTWLGGILGVLGVATISLAEDPAPLPRGYTIPTIDLADETHRQVVVDREKGQYLGHPTTLLLEDGKTILCVYPKGHGRGGIVYKRSVDGGKTWSERLPTPESWATSREVPTLHRVIDAEGKKRLILWSGLYPARLAVSEDDGANWSELKKVGDWGGIVVMGFVEKLSTPGHYLAMFHDDGRFLSKGGRRAKPVLFQLLKTFSRDGGLSWSKPELVQRDTAVHLCEPGCVWSPDRKELAVLLRENSRRRNSWVIFSRDEGKTFSKPRELPASLTGDRHTGKQLPDGRWFISFRDRTHESPTQGDWVAWVGTYEDIRKGREGQYRVRLADNTKGADCAYPGVELLPDGTIVTTTYGHWAKGEAPYILSVRLKLEELDQKAEALRKAEKDAGKVETSALPPLRLGPAFGSHMVWPRGQRVPLEGHAPPGEEVAVEFAGRTSRTRAASDGGFRFEVPPLEASAEPRTLRLCSGEDELVLEDILVGEVWLAAGQSNMEWPLQKTRGARAAIERARNHAQIRLLRRGGAARGNPREHYSPELIERLAPERFTSGEWARASAASAREFSAVGWYFAERLERELDLPIGVIDISMGGAPAEAFISRAALAKHPRLSGLVEGNWLENPELDDWCRRRGRENLSAALAGKLAIPGDDLGPNHSFKPTFLYDTAVADLTHFPVRGVIWYQGESNAESARRARQHLDLFECLVKDWRQAFGRELPWLSVQLPGMERPHWPAFREGQRRLNQAPGLALAVTIDLGLAADVHPRHKRPVGERLARLALAEVYGRKGFAPRGPRFLRRERAGDRLRLVFEGDRLESLDGETLRHFEIAGADGRFQPAEASIEGAATLVLRSAAVAAPLEARYAWRPFPRPPVNFGGASGLPAEPFTTEAEIPHDKAAGLPLRRTRT